MSSSKIVIKNSIIGTTAQICSLVISFFSQRYFLRYLGLEVQGINSVIGDTLGFLAFAELGVGTAITYRLYKPLGQKDTKELASLMQVYRFLYQIIGAVVFMVGLVLMVFLPVFINDAVSDMGFIRTAYLIQLFATASSYFFAYKRSLIFADQKQFVCKIVDICTNIFFSILRIISLICFHNFHIYLLLQFVQTLTANVILAYYCNKNYSFLKTETKEKFQDVKGLFKDTKDVLIGRVAGYVYSSTDNLVISTFSGIVLAGGFSNYKLVTNSVKNLVNSMTDSITATIGNYVQSKDAQESYRMFRNYTFIRYVVANIAATGLCICTDAFVGMAFGIEYVMQSAVLYLIVVDIFIGIVYGPLGEFTTVLGYFSIEKYINATGAIINIGLSVLLVQYLGVEGVLVGTCVSQVFFWVAKSILLFGKYFRSWENLRKMWISYIGYVALVVGQIAALYVLKQKAFGGQYTVVSFVLEGFICVGVSVAIISICYFKTEQYQYLISILKSVVLKVNRKNDRV